MNAVYTEATISELAELRAGVLERIKKNAKQKWFRDSSYLVESMVYWNFDFTALCIEVFNRKWGNEPVCCVMLSKASAERFLRSPDWTLFRDVKMDKDDHDLITEMIQDILNEAEA